MWRKALIGVGETARGGEGLNAASLILLGTVSHSRYRKITSRRFPALGGVLSRRCSSARPGTLLRGGFGRFWGVKFGDDQDLQTNGRNESDVGPCRLFKLEFSDCGKMSPPMYVFIVSSARCVAGGWTKKPKKLILLHSASRFSDGNGDNANQRVCPRQKNGSSISVNRLASLSFCRCQPSHRQRVSL